MPEGPEIHLAAKLINDACCNVIFTGKIIKSEVSKNPDVEWSHGSYRISATARGKELKLILTAEWPVKDGSQKKNKTKATKDGGNTQEKPSLIILFTFGMSGKFEFVPVVEKAKHAHLNFFTAKGNMVLSFVDYRRFGRWEVNEEWGKGRGPCVMTEAEKFRENVLSNLHNPTFNKPICEVLLNQEYFNGIGNYLRAEILYRLKIPPFMCARKVLEPLQSGANTKVKRENPDILDLCTQVPLEVYNLNEGRGHIYGSTDDEGSQSFEQWLSCYYKKDMNSMVDHNNRTIWFKGPAGPMVPKGKKPRGRLKRPKAGDDKVLVVKASPPKEKKAKVERDIVESNQTISNNKETKSTAKQESYKKEAPTKDVALRRSARRQVKNK